MPRKAQDSQAPRGPARHNNDSPRSGGAEDHGPPRHGTSQNGRERGASRGTSQPGRARNAPHDPAAYGPLRLSRLDASRRGATRRPTILFINRVYPPAEGATGVLLRDMAVNLVQRGWQVTILTGPSAPASASRFRSSSHSASRFASPSGDQPASRSFSPAEDAYSAAAGVRVVRVGGLAVGSSLPRRLFSFLLLYPALFIRALFLGRFDIVATKTDPPLLLVLSTVLGFLFRSRTIHWAQDLYPEVAEALGVLRPGGWTARRLRGLALGALRRHDRVVAVGRCMEDRLLERGIDRDRIDVIPNWPLATLRPIEHRFNEFRRAQKLQGKFVVMYSGNLGRAHTFDALLAAAREIKGAYPDVRFVIVGDGPQRDVVARRIAEEELDNVSMLPMQPSAWLSNSLSAGDLHVVTMQDEACGLVVPSKLYGAMAVRRPCLFLGPDDSEAALFVREHGAGEVLSEATGHGLALRILAWYRNDVRRRIAGDRAYRAVRLLRANAMIAFDDMLRNLVTDPVLIPSDIAPLREAAHPEPSHQEALAA